MNWSVIIPTIWKPASFPMLLEKLNECTFVDEIILIDNKPELCTVELATFSKVKRYPQENNIYVNPAWNLGVQRATSERICICNDDVIFDCDLIFSHFETRQLKGITGIHPDSFDSAKWNEATPIYSSEVHTARGWACILFLSKSAYKPIPHELKIWWGDAWLAWYARPAQSIITRVISNHSESVASEEFKSILAKDTLIWNDQLKPLTLKCIEWLVCNRDKFKRQLHQRTTGH